MDKALGTMKEGTNELWQATTVLNHFNWNNVDIGANYGCGQI